MIMKEFNKNRNYQINLGIAVTIFFLMVFIGCSGTYHRTNHDVAYKRPLPMESVERGNKLYLKFCLSCHGETAIGNGPNASDVNEPVANLRKRGVHISQFGLSSIIDYPHYSAEAVRKRIKEGNQVMAPLKDVLNKQEINDITYYVLSLIYTD